MNKDETLRNPRSCLNKAQTDEPVFVLKASDPLFAQTVNLWQTMANGVHSPEKRAEACKIAAQGEGWRKARQADGDHINKLASQGLGAPWPVAPADVKTQGLGVSHLTPSYEKHQEEQRNRAQATFVAPMGDAGYLRDMAQYATSSAVRHRLLAIAAVIPSGQCTAPPSPMLPSVGAERALGQTERQQVIGPKAASVYDAHRAASLQQQSQDAEFLRSLARTTTYNDSRTEATNKHRLFEIAMRIDVVNGYPPAMPTPTDVVAAQNRASGATVGSSPFASNQTMGAQDTTPRPPPGCNDSGCVARNPDYPSARSQENVRR